MKKWKILIVLLMIVVSASSCSGTRKFIEKGYSYRLIKEPAALHKVWMPRYVKYNKKQKRYNFINGHYRIVLGGQAWTYRKARLRNRFGRI